MRYVFWGLIGLIVLGVVVVGGGAYWLANVEVDFQDVQMTAQFKESFTGNCVTTFKQTLEKAKMTPTVEQTSGAEQACACARDPIVDILAKRPKMTVADLASIMADDPEIAAVTKACMDKFGIANPQ
jgi:hypothetical protein